jgi:hypothetical protein
MLLFLFAGVRRVVLFTVGFAVRIGAFELYMEPIWIYTCAGYLIYLFEHDEKKGRTEGL